MKSSVIVAVFGIVSVFAVGCAGPRTNLQASSAYSATDVTWAPTEESRASLRETHADRRPAERAPHH